MPANLTADFLKARERLQAATDAYEKLAALEEMLATIPKHKGTDKMQADIKRRIAKLRDSQGKKQGKGHSLGHVDREGAGQIALVGLPNTGKSRLLAAVTNAHPEVADYPFSTQFPVPGMMRFEDVPLQLVDLPPLTTEYTESWVYNVVRECDLALVLLDAARGAGVVDDFSELEMLLDSKNIALATERFQPDENRFRVVPCRILLHRSDLDPTATASARAALHLESDIKIPVHVASSTTGDGLDELRAMLFDAMQVVRIYTKLPGKKADLTEPYTLPRGSKAIDAVRVVHRDFTDKLKYVRVWGSSKFDGQQVPSDHPLEDGDIIEIHLS
ncbi:TGS domain-containing protein [Candidatus Bipolaricaulota bacterium]|nr:TGS domain-containing protein [Candidatus Bipolaricaulota bacterium]